MKTHGKIRKSKAYGVVGVLATTSAFVLAFEIGNVVNANDVASIQESGAVTTVLATVQADNADQLVATGSEIESTDATLENPTMSISDKSGEIMATAETSANDVISEVNDTLISDENSGTTTSTETQTNDVVSENSETNLSNENSEILTNSEILSSDGTAVESDVTGVSVTETTSVSLTQKGFDIQYNQIIADNAQLLFAVWSDKNGQDDLIWYWADKSGRVNAKYTGDYGTYYIHTYQNVNGKMIGLNTTEVDVAKPEVVTSIVQTSSTTYQVTVSNVPVYMSDISLPTWTTANGQDDIIWYKTTKSSDGTYSATISLAEHNLESGNYYVHVYGTSAVTGKLTGLSATSFKADYSFGDIQVGADTTVSGIKITMPSDVSSALTVYHAVWSSVNGQDDIVWYRADKGGSNIASYTGDYGYYNIHTYAVINGKMTGLSAFAIDVPKPNVSATVTKVTDTSYQITVSDVPVYITNIVLPTWTTANGQDDIKWTKTSKNDDGTYTATVLIKDHNFEGGHYNVHVYGTSQVTKSFVGLMVTDGFEVEASTIVITNPTVTVQNHNPSNGTLQVVIAETSTSKDIKSVRLAAWSEEKQANIYWYTTSSVIDGKVVITVDEKYHHNISGNYTVHVYVDTTNGETVGVNLGNYALNNTSSTSSVSTSYKGTGIYSINVSGVYSKGNVLYAVWSNVNGQDDIRWYNASTSGNNASGTINVANHSGTGTYNIHVYQNDNGKMYMLTSTTFTVDQTNFSTPYYSQRDGAWANTYYGYYSMAATGCVPTSLAMVFTSLTGTTVLPTTVASYLYNNTIEFNRGFAGTSGQGILMASQQWGMTATVLGSQSTLASTLQEGHHVLAAVQNNKFVLGGTHELVLKGYSNGMTYVYDPYNSSNNVGIQLLLCGLNRVWIVLIQAV